MLRFLEGDPHPAIEERIRHALGREPRDDVEGEIDGIQLDMGDGMQKGDASAQRRQRATGNTLRRYQFGLFRASGANWHRRIQRRAQGQAALAPATSSFLGKVRLEVEIGSTNGERCTVA